MERKKENLRIKIFKKRQKIICSWICNNSHYEVASVSAMSANISTHKKSYKKCIFIDVHNRKYTNIEYAEVYVVRYQNSDGESCRKHFPSE